MALRIALSGFVVLVVAMGIGRFAFTPQVPLMIAAGQLTLTSAGLVAAMNYLGYLVGAWDAMRAHRFVETRLWLGITGAVALTLLSAAADNAVVHGLLRFVIGCMSGWSMVLIAAWTNERLGQLGKPGLSAAVFAGPGAGIALSGHCPERAARRLYSGEVPVGRGGMANLRRAGAGADCAGGALPAAIRAAPSTRHRAGAAGADGGFKASGLELQPGRVWLYPPGDLPVANGGRAFSRQPVCPVCLADFWSRRRGGHRAQYSVTPYLNG